MDNKQKIDKKCPKCGSTNVHITKREAGVDGLGGEVREFICQNCGHSWVPPKDSWRAFLIGIITILVLFLICVILGI